MLDPHANHQYHGSFLQVQGRKCLRRNPTYKGSIRSLKDFWERRSKSFTKDYSIRSEGIFKLAKKIEGLINGKRLLEIGCGPGILARLYPEKTETIGLDFSLSMLRSARNRISRLVLGDSLNLPFCNQAFEVATCFFVASDYSEKKRIFSEAHRVLKTNGLFLYSDYSPRDEHWRFRREIRRVLMKNCDIHIEDGNRLSDKLKIAGFEVVSLMFIRFNAEFQLSRYLKSEDDVKSLMESGPRLWRNLKRRAESKIIKREFILLVSRKQ